MEEGGGSGLNSSDSGGLSALLNNRTDSGGLSGSGSGAWGMDRSLTADFMENLFADLGASSSSSVTSSASPSLASSGASAIPTFMPQQAQPQLQLNLSAFSTSSSSSASSTPQMPSLQLQQPRQPQTPQQAHSFQHQEFNAQKQHQSGNHQAGNNLTIPSFAPPTPSHAQLSPQTPPGLVPSLTPMGSPSPQSPATALLIDHNVKPKLEYGESSSAQGKLVPTGFLLQRQPILDSLWELQRNQNTQLELVRAKQKQLFLAPEKNLFEEVYRLQADLRNRIDAELKAVDQLYQNTVLTLGDLNKWLSLRHQVQPCPNG